MTSIAVILIWLLSRLKSPKWLSFKMRWVSQGSSPPWRSKNGKTSPEGMRGANLKDLWDVGQDCKSCTNPLDVKSRMSKNGSHKLYTQIFIPVVWGQWIRLNLEITTLMERKGYVFFWGGYYQDEAPKRSGWLDVSHIVVDWMLREMSELVILSVHGSLNRNNREREVWIRTSTGLWLDFRSHLSASFPPSPFSSSPTFTLYSVDTRKQENVEPIARKILVKML